MRVNGDTAHSMAYPPTEPWKRSQDRRVLELAAKGYSGRVIALMLGVSPRTVFRAKARLRNNYRQRLHPQDAASGWPGAATLPAAAG